MISRLIRLLGPRKLLCLAFDSLAFLLGIFCALAVGQPTLSAKGIIENAPIYLAASVVALISFRYQTLYKIRVMYSNLRQIIILSRNFLSTFLTLLVLYFFFEPHQLGTGVRINIALFVFFSYGFVVLNRFVVLRLIVRGIKPPQTTLKNSLAVGAGKLGCSAARTLQRHPELGYNLVAFVDDNAELLGRRIEGVEVCGSIDDIQMVAAEHEVEEIFLTINDIDHEDFFGIIERCKNLKCPINVVSDHFDVVEQKVDDFEFDELRFVTMFTRPNSVYQTTIKRVLDVIIATIIVVILSPVFLVVALLIKLTSKGPVLYVPESIGRDGKPFRFYKFRSMYNNVSNESHRQLMEDFISGRKQDGMKLQGDSRITPVGRFIRKYSIDEFPQLLNVIKGDMSLVGPRPSTQYEYDQMEKWHKRRYAVLPGMTGLWQVSGRSVVSFKDMVMMDIYYVENCSFWLDVGIFLKTFGVVIFGEGGH